MTLLLSQYKATRPTIIGITLSLMINFLIQTIFFVLSNTEVYSVLVAELNLVFYLELFQHTSPLFKVKYNHTEFFIFNILLKTSIQKIMDY